MSEEKGMRETEYEECEEIWQPGVDFIVLNCLFKIIDKME